MLVPPSESYSHTAIYDAAVEAIEPEKPRIVWEPLPGSQTLALNFPGHVILFHGSRGPGKTDCQLMRFRKRVGQGYGRHWRGIIFDREYKNLDDIVSKSLRWFPEFKDGARFISSKGEYKWVWPTGEELLFRAVKRSQDYWGYHGQEFPFIGWNELTKYPTEELFEALMSCNRSSYVPDPEDPESPGEIPLEVFATCNPYGAGHNWVKKRFISKAKMGQVVRTVVNVFNPRTQKREDVVKTQVHLFGSYRENKYLAPEYIAELELMTDKNKRAAWRDGNWDIVAGGMFDDVWDANQHVLRPFKIPQTWKIDRSFDWGASKPFSVGWWAESDGSDYIDHNGQTRSTVRGDLFRIAEWYGSTGKSNQGLNLLAVQISAGIVERQLALGIHNRVVPGPADSSIYDVENGNSYAADMLKSVRVNGSTYRGIAWKRSDKSPGSRKAGWQKLRKYLLNAQRQHVTTTKGLVLPVPREHPGMYVFDTCMQFQELFPVLPRDEDDQDDVDTEAEDHIGDETRYKVLSVGLGARSGTTVGMN